MIPARFWCWSCLPNIEDVLWWNCGGSRETLSLSNKTFNLFWLLFVKLCLAWNLMEKKVPAPAEKRPKSMSKYLEAITILFSHDETRSSLCSFGSDIYPNPTSEPRPQTSNFKNHFFQPKQRAGLSAIQAAYYNQCQSRESSPPAFLSACSWSAAYRR